MTKIFLRGGSYQSQSLIASAQRVLNLYAEEMPLSTGEAIDQGSANITTGFAPRTSYTYYPTPGLTLLGTGVGLFAKPLRAFTLPAISDVEVSSGGLGRTGPVPACIYVPPVTAILQDNLGGTLAQDLNTYSNGTTNTWVNVTRNVATVPTDAGYMSFQFGTVAVTTNLGLGNNVQYWITTAPQLTDYRLQNNPPDYTMYKLPTSGNWGVSLEIHLSGNAPSEPLDRMGIVASTLTNGALRYNIGFDTPSGLPGGFGICIGSPFVASIPLPVLTSGYYVLDAQVISASVCYYLRNSIGQWWNSAQWVGSPVSFYNDATGGGATSLYVETISTAVVFQNFVGIETLITNGANASSALGAKNFLLYALP